MRPLNSTLKWFLMAVVNFCNDFCKVGSTRAAYIFIGSIRSQLQITPNIVSLACTELTRKYTRARLELDVGYFLLAKSLSSNVQPEDWIRAYNVATQRHVMRAESENEKYVDKTKKDLSDDDTRLQLQMLCMLAIKDIVNNQFDEGLFLSNLDNVKNIETNLDAGVEFFGNDDDMRAQYWTCVVLFNIIGIKKTDLEEFTTQCPICYAPLGNRQTVNNGVKRGIILTCGHVLCKTCCFDSGLVQCPTCRDPLVVRKEQSALVGSFMGLSV